MTTSSVRDLDRIGRAHGLDLGIGLVDQGLDAAVNGLGHGRSPLVFLARHSGMVRKTRPGNQIPGSMLRIAPE